MFKSLVCLFFLVVHHMRLIVAAGFLRVIRCRSHLMMVWNLLASFVL